MSSLVQGTLKPGAQQNQTAITLAEEEQRSAELHQMRALRRQQRRSSTSGTEDQPASKIKKKLKHAIMKVSKSIMLIALRQCIEQSVL